MIWSVKLNDVALVGFVAFTVACVVVLVGCVYCVIGVLGMLWIWWLFGLCFRLGFDLRLLQIWVAWLVVVAGIVGVGVAVGVCDCLVWMLPLLLVVICVSVRFT